jgi:CTP:phosphocholine cytidylyltransferase-like protein
MEGFKVLITTSGVGSRLGELTNFTNKALVRVGKKPAISYIIESYPTNTEFVITCGYYGDQIKDFLKLVYPELSFTFVDVDNYKDKGSSLGYSMLKSMEYLQCPFIYHAADTVVTDRIPPPDTNWLGYCSKENYSQYRTIDLINYKIFDKGHIGSNLAYIGLCGIKDYNSFWESLQRKYSENIYDETLSDCHAINEIINKSWKFKKFDNWYDIGNVSELNKTREHIQDSFHLLDKIDESIFLFEKFVVKFFYDQTICKNRITRSNILGDLVPEVTEFTKNFYKYPYVDGDLLSNVVNENIFKDLLNWSKNNLWTKNPSDDDFKTKVRNFYFTKTVKRLNDFFDKNNLDDEEETINGHKVPKIMDLLNSVDWDWICNSDSYKFHGDFILDNIIYKNNKEFCLIDWRQDFAGDLVNGDIYYDLAKMNHNLLFNLE